MVKIEELIDNSDLTVLNKNLLFNFVFRAKEEKQERIKVRNLIEEEMETKFTRGIKFLNDLINQTETGSKEYKLLCAAKHRYIQDY